MRVFKVQDGTSWVARPDGQPPSMEGATAGWEAILFEKGAAGFARLVYRPAGWLQNATEEELAAALAEAEAVRARWGE